MLAVAKIWAVAFKLGKVPGGVGTVTGRNPKYDPFECGVPSLDPTPLRFHAQYYHYGIVFLIFDVEVAFLLPFAVAFLQLPVGAFLAMMVFVLLMAEGLVWAWSKGILTWK
jgi:NADH-quinone oxidoreductase subunit A